MFKIESYITPWIISHIDKYVKNIRPQDSQVSLWSGAVCFQNLDLRLEVLEEELQLPFSLLSGHVHELLVHVPWTKIASEPITITINTIEFVMKLRDPSDAVKKREKKKKTNKDDEMQAPPGYMASLLNKIANNISIKCNNIILKYVEDDIVASMNIQLLSYDSADDDWNPAFVDISPNKVLMRKIIKATDVTICLDKRNSAGKIEVCQEPILYRSTFHIRMLRKYNTATVHRSSITRIDIVTDQLNLNISTQQFPMLMRLLYLGYNLKQGNLRAGQDTAGAGEHSGDSQNQNSDESYFSWAWNLIPSIFPEDDVEEDDDEIRGHIFHTGFYVDQLELVFKSQELFGDPIMYSSKKIKYIPFLKVLMEGISCDAIGVGLKWFSTSGGVSKIEIVPMGDCPCGARQESSPFFASLLPNLGAYKTGSLFDPEAEGNFNYNCSWDIYLVRINDEYLTRRSPAMAFDMLHEIQEENDSGRISDYESDLEYSNLSERTLIRCVVSPFRVVYSSSLVHVTKTLDSFRKLYNYTPYVPEKPLPGLSQLTPPSTDDYDALMSDIPLIVYEITIIRPSIQFDVPEHKKPVQIKKLSRKFNSSTTIQLPSNNRLLAEIDRVSFTYTIPQYPNRLVYTTCQLPDPPANLFDACYNNLEGFFDITTISLLCNNDKLEVIEIPKISFNRRRSIRPDLWLKHEIFHESSKIEIDKLRLVLNRPQFYLLTKFMKLMANLSDSEVRDDINSFVMNQENRKGDIETVLNCIGMKIVTNTIGTTYRIDVETISGIRNKQSNFFSSGSHALSAIVQVPSNEETPSIFALKFSESCISVDSTLCDILNFDLRGYQVDLDTTVKIEEVPEKPVKKLPKMESVHSSSEVDTITPLPQMDEEKSSINDGGDECSWFNRVKSLVISVELGQFTMLLPRSEISSKIVTLCLDEVRLHQPNLEMSIIRFPFMTLVSSQSRPASVLLSLPMPIEMPQNVWTRDRECFPWTMSMWDVSVTIRQSHKEFTFLKPTKTSITLAITHREENFNSDSQETVDDQKSNIPLSLFLHIDTSPIVLNLSKRELTFLLKSIEKLPIFVNNQSSTKKLDLSTRSVNQNSNIDLKDLFGVANTAGTSTKDSMTVENTKVQEPTAPSKSPTSKISILLQWTLTKFSCQLYGGSPTPLSKLIIEFEDIISSVSRQTVFVKIKNKIGSVSCEFYQKDNDGGWTKNDSLGLSMRATEQNLSSEKATEQFLDLTITKAQTENVHSKWGTVKRDKNLIEYLTEIMVTVQQIDVRLNLDLLKVFVPIFEVFGSKTIEEENVRDDVVPKLLCVTDLPLVYFHSKGIHLFLPTTDGANCDNCDVCIVKISEMSLSPNVDNPMTRVPIRPDIYTKAAQLRMLNARGSKIEDRQYEYLLRGISMATGSWNDLSNYMESVAMGTLHENPAVEWNQNQQNAKKSFELRTIFKDFNFSVVFAPNIIFKDILVCGSALELNCLTDLIIDVDSDQIELASRIHSKISNLLSTMKRRSKSVVEKKRSVHTIEKTSNYDIIESTIENVHTDSGFESHATKSKSFIPHKKSIKSLATMKKNQLIPFDVWFVGGVFTANVHKVCDGRQRPLFSLSVHQPNSTISQTIFEKTLQLSIFDVKLSFDDEVQGPDVLFETRRGELDLHGIPQPLIKIKYVENLLKDNEVEIYFNRPIKVRFSHKTFEKIDLITKMLKPGGLVTPRRRENEPVNEIKPISGNFNIKTLRSALYGVSHTSVFVSQVLIHSNSPDEGYDLKLGIARFQAKIDVIDRPEKINFNVMLKSLTLAQHSTVILHPLTLDVCGNFTQENWKKIPSIFIVVNSNYIQLDVSPDVIANLMKVKEIMMESDHGVLQSRSNVSGKRRTNSSSESVQLTPKLVRKASSKNVVDEYYQDDLRAGAFQFIEAHFDTDLPLPYQILIQNKEKGIICWRYPQPRALNHVQVFPVPFQTSTELKIKCNLEYYSEPHATFQPYTTFNLSENETTVLNLPRRKITSSIWRIVMIQSMVSVNSTFFQDDHDSSPDSSHSRVKNIDEILEKSSKHRSIDYMVETDRDEIFHLHPKVLVACMKIDSFFSAAIIPKLQSLVNVSQIQLNLFNSSKPDSDQPPPEILKNYTFLHDFDPVHRFLAVNVRKLKVDTSMFTELETTTNFEFDFSSEILDYGYLSMQSLVDEFHVESSLELTSDRLKINLITSEIKLKYGPSIGHTLAVSERLWTRSGRTNVILTRFIVCNDTNSEILFGQSGTDEKIYLTPKTCCLYPFRTERQDQKFSFTLLETLVKEPSDPVQIGNEGIQYVQMEASQFIIVKTVKISPSQRRVTLKGQTEFINMSTHSFTVSYNGVDTSSLFKLENRTSFSVFGFCHDQSNQSIKIQLNGPTKKGWSGVIPLQKSGKNNAPWLVKVPTNTRHEFISFWVRVMRENITDVSTGPGGAPHRVLVVIWPLFMIKSMLSIDTIAIDQTDEDEFSIPGRGVMKELELSGTVENDHELIFKANFVSPYGEDKRRALLSYKLIDRNEVFTIPEKYNSIEKCVEELERTREIKWPCYREEELRLNRETTFNEVTTPIYNCSLSQELSCSLMLNILPSSLFINSTGVRVKLSNPDGSQSFLIDPNHIGMMTFVTTTNRFKILFEDEHIWRESSIICLNSSPTKAELIDKFETLNDGEHLIVTIYTVHGLVKLSVTTLSENGTRIIILSSCYVVCNFTSYQLNAFAYSVRLKEKRKITKPSTVDVGYSEIVRNSLKTQNPLGTPVVQFLNLSPENRDPTTKFNYFLSITSSEQSEYSNPILLNHPFNRKSISVTCDGQNIPFIISSIEHNNQTFISIYEDTSAAFLIENFTELKFFIAQSTTIQPNAHATAVKECLDDPFDWYQTVNPKCRIHYTPVCLDNIFPDVKDIDFALIFAVESEGSPVIKWSTPIQVNETKDVIVKLPQHDGIKLSVDCRNKTTKLIIGYISENQEFCVRDLRLRLSNPIDDDGLDSGRMNEIIEYSDVTTSSPSRSPELFNFINPSSEKSRPVLKLNVVIKELSFVIFTEVDTRQWLKHDLVSFNFDDVAITFDETARRLNFGSSNFQIDNLRYMSRQYDFPVVLCAQSVEKNDNSIVGTTLQTIDDDIVKCFKGERQLIRVFLKFYENEMKMESINFKLNPIRAYLEDTYLNHVFDFLIESLPTNLIYLDPEKTDRIRLENGKIPLVIIPRFIEKQSLYLSESFKLNSIKINPLDILLSVHTSLRMYIALDHSPLSFSTFERRNVNTLPMKLGYVIGKHYLERAAIGAGWVVGSLEILGSPSGLARSVTTGIKDFVSMPVQGLLRGPWGFLVGLTHGSASLIRNVTAGTVNSVSKLAGSVARNLDWLTHDQEHLMITDSIRRSRPQGITEGISQGLAGLGISLLGAVGGLARHPMEATSPVGVFTGVGKGIVGAFTKPISGAAELVHLTGQGVLQSVGYNPLPIPRDCISKSTNQSMSAYCKISWKLLKPIKNIIFSTIVTMKVNSTLKPVLMCMTSEIIAFLSIDSDELIEVLPIQKITESIDENDPTLIILKQSIASPSTTDQNSIAVPDDLNRMPISPRTYQFVWDSIEQRGGYNLHNFDLNEFPSNDDGSGRRIEVFIDQHLSEYFIRYLSLIKRTTSTERVLFSIFD